MRILLFIISLTLSIPSLAQTDSSAYISLNQESAKMADLLMARKNKEYVKYMYPKVVSMAGGASKVMKALKKVQKQMDDSGVTRMLVFFNAPSEIITENGLQQAVVPEILELRMKGGRVVTKSSMIAISSDQGKHWTFIDTTGKTMQAIKMTLPEISARLVIPVYEQPEVHMDEK